MTPPMKARHAVQALALAACLGCHDSKTARDITDPVLKASDLACVMNSMVIDSAELAAYCHLADILIPIVRRLVSVREAARRSGVVYQGAAPPADPPSGAEHRP